MDLLFLAKRKGRGGSKSKGDSKGGGGDDKNSNLSPRVQGIIIGVVFGLLALVLIVAVVCIFRRSISSRWQRLRHQGTSEGRGPGVIPGGDIRMDGDIHRPAEVSAGHQMH